MLDPGICVRIEPTLTGQILTNLTHNAFKFTLQGKVTLRVGWRQTPEGGRARFEVVDNGIGIARDKQPNIFDPFTQVESNYTRRYEGVGLGLAICAKLIDVLGGEIGFESELGAGSVFWFETPAELLDTAREVDSDDEPFVRAFSNVRILVVEDNPDNRHLLVGYLQRLGADVMTANSGEAALDRCRQHAFHFVLMDISMPDMDGFETTRRIRAEARSLPKIIAVTAHASEQVKAQCLDCGMVEHLPKPVTLGTLQTVLLQHYSDLHQ